MQSLLELVIVIAAIYIFAKYAGLCKKFSLSAGFKKFSYFVLVAALIGLNIYASNVELTAAMVGIGFVVVMLFTLALMSETKTTA